MINKEFLRRIRRAIEEERSMNDNENKKVIKKIDEKIKEIDTNEIFYSQIKLFLDSETEKDLSKKEIKDILQYIKLCFS